MVRNQIDLIHRDREKGVLDAQLDGAIRGEGSTSLIEGPFGTGKSELLHDAIRSAAARGMAVFRAVGGPTETGFRLGLTHQLLGTAPTSTDSGADSAPPDHGELLGLFQDVVAAAHGVPMLIAVDDIQWADCASLSWLCFLHLRLHNLPAALILTRCQGEGAQDNSAHLSHLVHTVRPEQRLYLDDLALSEAAELVARQRPDLSAAQCQLIAQAAGGNPQLLVNHADDYVAESKDVHFTPGPRLEAAHRRLLTRIGRSADESVVRVAVAAGLFPDGSTLGLLTDVSRLPCTTVANATDWLVRANLLHDRSFVFRHPMHARLLYRGTDREQRTLLHARAAHALRRAGAGPVDIAAHLRHVTVLDEPWMSQILLTSANRLARHAPSAALDLTTALLRHPSCDELVACAHRLRGRILASEDLPAAACEFRLALEKVGAGRARAELAVDLANVLTRLDQNAEARMLLREGEEWSTRTRQPDIGRWSSALRDAAFHSGEPVNPAVTGGPDREVALVLAQCCQGRSADFVRDHADQLLGEPCVPHGSRAWYHLLLCLLWSGAPDRAQHYLAEAQRLLSPAASAASIAEAHAYTALVHLHQGELEAAQNRAEAALAGLRAIGAAEFHAGALAETVLLDVALVKEDLEYLAAVAAAVRPRPRPSWWALNRDVALARSLLRLGSPHRAVRMALRWGEHAQKHQIRNPAMLAWRSTAAAAYHRLGRLPEAHCLILEETELARQWGAPQALGHALLVASSIATGTNALQLSKDAVTVLKSGQSKLELAHALHACGAAHLRVDEPHEAREPLRRAADLAVALGVDALAERVQQDLRAAGGRPNIRAVTRHDLLTFTERHVAELACSGMSNRKIAAQLRVSVRNVESHLTRVYRKLQVKGRQELAQALLPEMDRQRLGAADRPGSQVTAVPHRVARRRADGRADGHAIGHR